MDIIKKNWNSILQKLKEDHEIKDIPFDTWIKPLEPFKLENKKLYIIYNMDEAQNETISYIKKKYEMPLMVTISEFTNEKYEIIFLLKKDANKVENKISEDNKESTTYKTDNNFTLNPKYKFETFVVGSSNSFAYTACLAVAESVGEIYNPLYIHGGPGLGKTHLMHAICQYILDDDSSKKILYVTSEQFTNEVVDSIKKGNNSDRMNQLREKYRSVDVLIVDDIQFLIGKEATQNEFFHTFNTLHEAGKQVIITSDRSPEELETFDNRIKSRLEWGLQADIGIPDYETRVAIIRKKMESHNYTFSDEIVNYIATNIKSNVRKIEGALNKLSAIKMMNGGLISIENAQKELKSFITTDSTEITPQLIIETVADYYNVEMDQMISTKRSQGIVIPRQIAMYICSQITDLTTTAIGSQFGKNHSTVIHSNKKVEEELLTQEKYRNDIETIKSLLKPSL